MDILPFWSTLTALGSLDVQWSVLMFASCGCIVAVRFTLSPLCSHRAALHIVTAHTGCITVTFTCLVMLWQFVVTYILAVPRLIAVTSPLPSTWSMLGSDDRNLTVWLFALLGVIVLLIWNLCPASNCLEVGFKVRPVTCWRISTCALPMLFPQFAIARISTKPLLLPVTTPVFGSTVAILGLELSHLYVLSLAFAGRIFAINLCVCPYVEYWCS